MSRRNIKFNVHVAGNPTHLLMADWTKVAGKEYPQQSLIYSNSAKACDETLIPRLTSTAREKIPFSHGVFLALTGECGLMMKWFLMAAFCGEMNEEIGNESSLPTIWCMPCTSAANCGVSSTNCTACFRVGPPPSFHEMVQEMGRVDRLHTADVGTNSYSIYLNLNTFLSLWMRVQCENNALVKDRTNDELHSILRCLVLPEQCFHSLIENHFENPRRNDTKDGCNDQCSYCDGSYRNFGARLSKSQLIAVLTTHVFSKGLLPAMSLISRISSKENKLIKQAIWKGKGGQVNAGHVHNLVLMLIASKILELSVPPNSKEANNNKIPLKSIEIGLAKEYVNVGDDFKTLSIYVDANWEGIPHDP